MPAISDAKILIISASGFEQSELETPLEQLKERGATVHVASPKAQVIKGWMGSDWGTEVKADLAIEEADPADYDALVLPGGQINPDLLRLHDDAVALVRRFHETGKTVGAICHAPWLLIEAGIVKGRAATSYSSIRTDLRNAGADWQDKAVVTDHGIVTSRNPGDLDDFVQGVVDAIESDTDRRAA